MLSENEDLLTRARNRVRIGPSPDWVTPTTYNREFTAKVRRALTHLVIERQAYAELQEQYFHHALRLETMQAVQHHSQWRLEFAPKTEWVVLHSVKTRRGEVEREHLSLEKIQFLRREAGLEGFIIDGGITVLLLLEDVAVGDVLEFSYTIKSQPRLLPNHWSTIFDLPLASEIGKHYFSVRHGLERQMKWKASSQSLAPVVNIRKAGVGGNVVAPHPDLFDKPLTPLSQSDGEREQTPTAENAPSNDEVELIWQGENVVTLEPEEGTPISVILYPWMQFSDCPDWQTVARAVAEAWPPEIQGDGLKKVLREIKTASADLPGQVNEAIKMVQDGFRYLSVNVELGGQIPAEPETVIRRRYGDCKDLALLLTVLLRSLGVSARPVLVHGGLRKAISGLLPSPWFNHVIVEFQIGEERRWIDATMKFQGGGALKRMVGDFGFGLPVDANATELVSVPKGSLPTGSYELKDSFLLDTSGSPSHLAVQVTAKGIYAEQMRAEIENGGVSAVSKRRLQACADRFCRAARVGELQWRDEREKNELVLVEVFEIEGFLKNDPQTNSLVFEIRSDATAGMLLLPPQINRRDPFALPFPCRQSHTVEIDFLGLEVTKVQSFESDSKFFKFSRSGRSVRKFIKITFDFSTLTDTVPAGSSAEYRKQVETTWRASILHLRLPPGYMRIRKRGDFGSLPATTSTGSVPPVSHSAELNRQASMPADEPLAPAGNLEPAFTTGVAEREQQRPIDPGRGAATMERRTRRTHHRGSESYYRGQKIGTNKKCLASVCLAVAGVLMLFVAFAAGATPAYRSFAGLVIYFVYPTVAIAVVLAILGLKECRRAGRKDNGKMMAIITLAVSSLAGFILVPTLVSIIEDGLHGRRGMEHSELLKFPSQNFAFQSPTPPWKQLDVRGFNPRPAVSFVRPGPTYFVIYPMKLNPNGEDPRAQLVGLCKVATIDSLNPFRVIREETVKRKELEGWQLDVEGTLQGRQYYFINWAVVTNGLGYVLRIWGPPEMTAEIKQQSEDMFSRFKPVPPQDPPR